MNETRSGFFADFEPGEKRVVFFAALIAMLRMFGVFALLPVLSVYAAAFDDATPMLIGLAVGAYGLTQAGMQIPLGILSDRLGRKPVIAGALLLLAVGSVIAATSDSIYGVIAGRLLQGAGAISAALVALIADETRESVRTRSMALYGIGFGIAFMVAVIAGPVIAAAAGVEGVFWVAAGGALLAVALLSLVQVTARPTARASYSLRPALRSDLLRLDVFVFLLHAILTASFVALPFLFTQRLELAMVDHWMIYLLALAVSLVITVPMLMRDDRRGKTANLRLAIALIVTGEFGFAFLGSSTLAVAGSLALFFGGFNFLEAGLPARVSSLADGSARGASLGVFATAQFLGIFAGGLLGGRFLEAGTAAVFVSCGLLATFWLLIAGIGGNEAVREAAPDQARN